MIRRSRVWKLIGFPFIFLNVAAAVWVARRGEPLHMAVHVGLALLVGGIYLAWRLARGSESEGPPTSNRADEAMRRLEESLDSVAVEVERIGEAQRFSARVLQQRAERGGQSR